MGASEHRDVGTERSERNFCSFEKNKSSGSIFRGKWMLIEHPVFMGKEMCFLFIEIFSKQTFSFFFHYSTTRKEYDCIHPWSNSLQASADTFIWCGATLAQFMRRWTVSLGKRLMPLVLDTDVNWSPSYVVTPLGFEYYSDVSPVLPRLTFTMYWRPPCWYV